MRRGHHGSTKVPNVKLKPVPKSGNYSRDPGVALYDATSGTARDSLRNDARPFSGFEICGSGVKDKIVLFGKARELGATCSNDLTDLTTHLVADEPGSAKYQCAVELGIPVLTSDWILDTHTRWLAGVDIDPEECTSEHLLPPLKGVVICATRLSNTEDRQRVTKSAVRLGAKYQAHMDKAATHLLIGPDDAATVDSQKLQWVLRTNEKRLKEQSEEPRIHVVWDSWLLYCAATSSRVPEGDFAYSENGTRPDPPDDIERVLRRSLNKKPAKVYVTASNVGAGTKGKDVLEKARIKKGAPAASVWNGILSARGQGARDDDSFVPPTQMQVVPNSTSSISVLPMPVSDAPPPQIDVDDSATEDEDESTQRKYGAASSSRAEPKSVVPAERGIAQGAQIGAGKATSMVSRLNSLRGSAFQFGTGATSNQNASSSSSRPLARITSAAAPGQGMTHAVTTAKDPSLAPTSAGSCKVFAGKCIAPIGEARAPKMYSALRAHGAIVIEGLDAPLQSKGKGTAKDDETVALPQEEVDYYIVRLASESARSASKLECFHKFRTDCWVEHCIFQDRLCLVEEDITYSPLKAQLPIPGLENVKLHWTGMNNEQETAAKRLTKALGITVTDTFNRRINTHLLCPSGSGLKYNKALQWKVPVVKMDWLYDIAKQGRIPDIPQAQSHPNDTSATGNETTAGPSMLQPTSPHTTSKNTSANISLFGTPNGLLGPSVSSPEPAALPPLHDSTTTVLAVSNQSSARDEAAPIASTSADQLETTLTSSTKDSSRPEDTSARRSQSKDLEVHLDQDGEREREAHRNQLADSLGELLKKHQLDEPAQHDQPRKRMRPPQRQKGAVGATSGTTSRSHSLSDKVSLMSLQTRASDSDYISPLEAMEPVHEETLQVHYLDPNQHAAKEGLLRLLDGSSQVVDPDIINLDTQTEPEESQARPQVITKRKRGGAAGGGGKRKNQRKA